MKKFSKIQEIVSPKKIKFNYCIILTFLLFSISFVLADTEQTHFEIKIYEDIIKITSEDILISESEVSKDHTKIFDLVAILTNGSEVGIGNLSFNGVGVAKLEVKEKIFDFVLIFTQNTTLPIDTNYLEKYYICVTDKASINSGYTTCAIARDKCLEEYEGENATTNKEALDACNLRTQQKDIEIQGQLTTIGNLEEEEESTGNVKYIWGIVSGIIGIIGALLYCGKIGKGSVKEKSDSEFNKSQQG